jgi:D-tyrosyl-tRNA(Tyr) deacylase
MEPAAAEAMYERFIDRLERLGVPCAHGVFGAMMDVCSVNDGPVTILLDSKKLF